MILFQNDARILVFNLIFSAAGEHVDAGGQVGVRGEVGLVAGAAVDVDVKLRKEGVVAIAEAVAGVFHLRVCFYGAHNVARARVFKQHFVPVSVFYKAAYFHLAGGYLGEYLAPFHHAEQGYFLLLYMLLVGLGIGALPYIGGGFFYFRRYFGVVAQDAFRRFAGGFIIGTFGVGCTVGLYLVAVFYHAEDEGLVLVFHFICDLGFRIDDQVAEFKIHALYYFPHEWDYNSKFTSIT